MPMPPKRPMPISFSRSGIQAKQPERLAWTSAWRNLAHRDGSSRRPPPVPGIDAKYGSFQPPLVAGRRASAAWRVGRIEQAPLPARAEEKEYGHRIENRRDWSRIRAVTIAGIVSGRGGFGWSPGRIHFCRVRATRPYPCRTQQFPSFRAGAGARPPRPSPRPITARKRQQTSEGLFRGAGQHRDRRRRENGIIRLATAGSREFTRIGQSPALASTPQNRAVAAHSTIWLLSNVKPVRNSTPGVLLAYQDSQNTPHSRWPPAGKARACWAGPTRLSRAMGPRSDPG